MYTYLPGETPPVSRLSTGAARPYQGFNPAPAYPRVFQGVPHESLPRPSYAPPSYREVKQARQQRFKQDLDEQIRLKNERKRREDELLQLELAKEQQYLRNSQNVGQKEFAVQESATLPPELYGNGATRDSGLTGPSANQVEARRAPSEDPKDFLYSRFGLALPPNAPIASKGQEPHTAPPEFMTPRGTTYSRFRVDRALPEVQNERQDRHRKQQEVERMLRLQLEEKNRRKAEEKKRKEEEETREAQRLEREREELRLAYEREKQGVHRDSTNQPMPEWPNTHQESDNVEETNFVEQEHLKSEDIFHPDLTQFAVDSRELQAFREELLSQHDSLKQQVETQEKLLRELQREVKAVKLERDARLAKEESRQQLELVLTSKSKLVPTSGESPDIILQRGGLRSPVTQPVGRANQPTATTERLSESSFLRFTEKGDTSSWDEDNTDQLDQLLKDFITKRR